MTAKSRRYAAVAAAVALGVGSLVIAGSATAGTAGASPGTCAATFRATGNWGGGFQGEVAVTNSGTTGLNGWRVTVNLPAGTAISNLWSGVNSGTSGAVTVTNAGYNGSLGAGQSTAFGFIATGSDSGTTVACSTLPTETSSSATPSASPSTSPSTSPSAGPSTSPSGQPAGVLSQAHTVGRLVDQGSSVQYTWPGVYFEGRFRGTAVGLVLDDTVNDYEIQVDTASPVTVVQPGRTTYWIRNLTDGDHTVRIAKRTESPWAAGQFGGFVAGPGGSILARPAARTRQIEFIGDSWTAGYGNTSTSRDCAATGGIDRNTNANQSFGALTARGLNADYQINAWSGRGMVRNYNGSDPGVTYRTYYDRTLQAAGTQTWPARASWRPQVVVIGLGINDFSTPLNAGEPWANATALATAYRSAYQGFLDKLRGQYGTGTHIVLTYPDLSYTTTAFADSIKQIVQQRNSQGDARVHALYYDNNALGLDTLGCDWHPSARDHRILAATLSAYLNTLPLNW